MSEASEGAAPADEAAVAFEELRQEIALMRRAVAGLSAEHASIEVPDYSQTLGKMAAALNAILKTNKEISEAPASGVAPPDRGSPARAGEPYRAASRSGSARPRALRV